jgi:cytochrome c553
MRRNALLAAALLAVVVPAHAQVKGNPQAGANKAGTCAGCHGIAGWRNAYPAYNVPKLGGQHANYIVSALQAYKGGQRNHPGMQGIATSLSNQDIADLAAFLSAQPQEVPAAERRSGGDPAEGKRKSAPCQACHGPDGNSPSDQFPRLAGQYSDYLTQALLSYKDGGSRKNPIMAGFAAPLTERDIEDLAAYFASQAKGLYTHPRVELSPNDERSELPAPDPGKQR